VSPSKGSERYDRDRTELGELLGVEHQLALVALIDELRGRSTYWRRRLADADWLDPGLWLRKVEALPKLESLGDLFVLQEIACKLKKVRLGFFGCEVEELASSIDPVHAPVGELSVQLRFDPDGVVGEEERMRVVSEGTRPTSHAM
jgi:hypothetical protein